jgi:hypothetical protein
MCLLELTLYSWKFVNWVKNLMKCFLLYVVCCKVTVLTYFLYLYFISKLSSCNFVYNVVCTAIAMQ